jgi:hypothetical protein
LTDASIFLARTLFTEAGGSSPPDNASSLKFVLGANWEAARAEDEINYSLPATHIKMGTSKDTAGGFPGTQRSWRVIRIDTPTDG